MLKDELIEFYEQSTTNHTKKLSYKLYDVVQKLHFNDFTLNDLEQIIDFERYVICNKGVGRMLAERRILEAFNFLTYGMCEILDFEIEILDERLIEHTKDEELRKIHQVSFRLLKFAKELSDYSIPRDSFTSRRKGFALGIISQLSNYYTISNRFDLFIEALQSKKEKLIVEALKELHVYYEEKPDEPLAENIVKELDCLILNTKNRSIASGVLNLQVITKHISEFEALDRIDDWKEKYLY